MKNRELTDTERAIFNTFHTDAGKELIEILINRYVLTDIVKDDGIIPSSVREGKSELVRFINNVYKSVRDE